MDKKKKKGFGVPHTYVLILCVIVAVMVMTYVVPAGAYDRVTDPNTGKSVPDVESFHFVENTPVNPWAMVQAIPKGMTQAAGIAFFVFLIGGAFAMIKATGAIDGGVVRFISLMKKRETLVIPAVMFLFSVLGFSIGAAEELIVFIPIACMISRGFGWDDIVGVAMVSTGACAGFAGGMLNPFTTGIGQGIAELPLYSGAGLRTIGYVFFLAIAVAYVMNYAKKVKADPKNSLLYGMERPDLDVKSIEETPFTTRHKLVLVAFAIGLIVMVWGVMTYGWYTTELGALFLIIGVVAALIGGLNSKDAANAFVAGAKDIVFGALVIGLARAILVILTEGQILDSIVYYASGALEVLPNAVTSVGIFWVNAVINFFIPSGSGQISTMVPIMAPLADILGITRQTAVLAVTYGDAFTNQIVPTSGALLGALGIVNVPYEKWLKYNWKMVAMWIVMGSIMLVVASAINYGPF
jgi:uncharacterized ion transporter superfamily protein YfcC